MEDTSNYIFIGWCKLPSSIGETPVPIMVSKYITWEPSPMDSNAPKFGFWNVLYKFTSLKYALKEGYQRVIALEQLYKLPNIRNLDLYEVCYYHNYNPNYTLLTSPLFTTEYLFEFEPQSQLETKEQWYSRNREKIELIEKTYPGLFKPIFITPVDTSIKESAETSQMNTEETISKDREVRDETNRKINVDLDNALNKFEESEPKALSKAEEKELDNVLNTFEAMDGGRRKRRKTKRRSNKRRGTRKHLRQKRT